MKLPHRQAPSGVEWLILCIGLAGVLVLYTITLHSYAYAKGVQSVSPCIKAKPMSRKVMMRWIKFEKSKGFEMNLNDYLMSHRDLKNPKVRDDYDFPLVPRVVCADGFSISVQASHGAYCSPRTNIGHWYQVECGFPSDTPTEIMDYCENSDKPTKTVYGYVPIELVEDLIAAHGGMK